MTIPIPISLAKIPGEKVFKKPIFFLVNSQEFSNNALSKKKSHCDQSFFPMAKSLSVVKSFGILT